MNISSYTIMSVAAKRVRLTARLIRYASVVTLTALVASSAYVLFAASPWRKIGIIGVQLDASDIEQAHMRLASVIGLAPHLLLAYGLLRLLRLARACEDGRIFSVEGSGHLLAFSIATFCAQILQVLTPLLVYVALRLSGGHWDRPLAVSLHGSEMWGLFVTAIFVLLSWMLEAGRGFAEDSESIV
jgi:hypothetical protein